MDIERRKPQKKPFLLFVFRGYRSEWLSMWISGEGASDFLYGLPYLDGSKFNVGFVEGDNSFRNWKRWLCLPIEHILSSWVRIGFGMHIVWMHWRKMRRADILISTVDTCGLPLAMFKYIGVLKTPLIYISQGLAHRMEALSPKRPLNRFLRTWYTHILHSVDKILVFGEGASQPLTSLFDLPPGRVSVLPFGIDDEFWKPDNREAGDGGFILSVGSDAARDYPTLLQAIDGQDLRIVTRQHLPRALISKTVYISSKLTPIELRRLYQRARFVVIPLKDVDQPSGQSATLQAMACRKAVILTRTRGLWAPEQMRHLETCYLVEPNNVNGLRKAISFLETHPQEIKRIGDNAFRLVKSECNSRLFAKNLEHFIVSLTNQ